MAHENWLITGGCGFIGANLVGAVIRGQLAETVSVLDNLSVGTTERLESALALIGDFDKSTSGERIQYELADGKYPLIKLFVGDIRDRPFVEKAVKDIGLVVHLAASTGVPTSVENPLLDMESNVVGTFNMLEASRKAGIDRFIFASSGAPVGESEPPIHERKVPRPVSPYGASKLAGEGYCSAYYRSFGIATVALRFGNVYGPGSGHKESVVAKFVRQAMKGETLEVYGDGTQTRDYIFIDDLVRAVLQAASVDGIGGEVFQIATNAETTVDELVSVLLRVLADTGTSDVRVNHTAPRVGDVTRNFSDTSKARDMLGWQAEVSLSDGLRHTVEWFAGRKGPS